MKTDRLVPPVYFAELDMDEVDRRIGRRPFARGTQRLRIARDQGRRHQRQGEKPQ
jgi:hypothetical protein